MSTTVLVAYASKHGSTKGIAQAIGGALHSHGCQVTVSRADQVHSVAAYDVVIIGSAIYHDHWLWDGRRLLKRARSELGTRPLWLFSSGPVGGTAQGEELIAEGCGAGVVVPSALRPALTNLQVMDHALFAGRVDERAAGMLERDLPRGDWRNFRQVADWGHRVGDEVASAGRVRRVAQAVQVAHAAQAAQAAHAVRAAQLAHAGQAARMGQVGRTGQVGRIAQTANGARG